MWAILKFLSLRFPKGRGIGKGIVKDTSDKCAGMQKRHRDADCELSGNKRFSLCKFTPSKNRDVGKNALAGAAQNQLSGKALPSLAVCMGHWRDADDHVRAASHVNATADLINTALSTEVKASLTRCVRDPAGAICRRENALFTHQTTSDKLSEQRAKWIAKLPENSPAAETNCPLISLLSTTLLFRDKLFVTDLSRGMPIAGPVAKTPGLAARKRNAEMSYAEWKRAIPDRNAKIYDRVRRSQGSELAGICWERTMAEVEVGWITPPVDLTDAMLATLPLTPRYAIKEQHSNQDPKFRLIDDFRASDINAIIQTEDTNIPDTLDVMIALASCFALISPGCNLLRASADFAHAYKHVPIAEDQRDFATILIAPPAGALKVATLRTQPFGSRRAPTNWPRVANFLKRVTLTVFGVIISVYVDDVFIVEQAETIISSYNSFKIACAILGFQLEESKQQDPTKTPSLLGAEITSTQNWITARLPGRKRKDLVNEMKQILTNGHLTHAQAVKLRGRLGFTQSLLFGRLGRALLNPLSGRQYAKITGRYHPITDEIKLTLE